jgi:hypothetical protein
MSRLWAKCALCLLVVAAVCDATSQHRRRLKDNKSAAHKEALMDWEQEGGALPSGPPIQ